MIYGDTWFSPSEAEWVQRAIILAAQSFCSIDATAEQYDRIFWTAHIIAEALDKVTRNVALA